MGRKLKTGLLALSLSLIVIVTTSFKNMKGSDPDADAFGVKLIEAVKANNYELFKKLTINISEYTDVIMATDLSDDEKVEEIERFKRKQEQNTNEEFRLLLKQIQDSGIDFAKIKFDKVRSEFNSLRESSSFPVTVHFNDGTISAELRASQCYKTRNGIKLKSFPRLKKGSVLDPTCDAFAKEIFEMLKKENKEEYRKYVITTSAFIALVKVIEEINENSPESDATGHFYGIMADIYKKNIDLNKVQNLTWEYKKEQDKGVHIANITLYFDYESKKYSLRTREAFKTSAGWKLSREMRLERNSYEPDYTEEAVEEIYEEAPIEEAVVDTTAVSDEDMEKALQDLNKEIKRQMEADSVKPAQLEKDKKKKKGKK
jgi:hypothetical protein